MAREVKPYREEDELCRHGSCSTEAAVMLLKKQKGQPQLACKRHAGWLLQWNCGPKSGEWSATVIVTLLYELSVAERRMALRDAWDAYEAAEADEKHKHPKEKP